MNTLGQHIALERRKRLEGRIYWPKGSPKIVEATRTTTTVALDTPVETIEVDGVKLARLPLGLTRTHIDGMIKAGALSVDNIFVGSEALKNAKINPEIPQVFGYTIANDSELARVITDPATLKAAREEAKKSRTCPTIFLGNHEAQRAHAAHLGGRVPTQIEQIRLWDKLPERMSSRRQ